MMSLMALDSNWFQLLLLALFWGVYGGLPALFISGWVRLSKDKNLGSTPRLFAVVGFSLATGSARLGLFTFLYARLIHSFPYYDPTLMRIYAFGSLLALAGVLSSVGGIWRRGPI
jgi:hypothetical protein